MADDYKEAKLNIPKPGNEDWYVYFSVKDSITGKWVRTYIRSGIKKKETFQKRKAFGNALAAEINLQLKEGWRPDSVPEETAAKIQKDKNQEDFYWWFEEALAYRKAKNSYGNWRHMYKIYRKLKDFSPQLKVTDVTYKFIQDFERYLHDKGLHTNTVADTLIRTKVIINDIIRSGAMEYHKNPFLKFKIQKVRTKKERLTMEEITELEKAELSGVEDMVRDMYLISYYCAGIRFGDICRLSNDHIQNGYLVYTMHKSDKKRQIILIPDALKILEKYPKEGHIFETKVRWATILIEKDKIDAKSANVKEEQSLLARNAFLNKVLKRVCSKIGISSISFHSSRRTFTDLAIKNRTDMRTLKDLLGHSTITTTEIYAKDSYPERSEAAMNQIFAR